MATHALQPGHAPANPLHDRFDNALRDYACAAVRQVGLPPSSTMAQDLAAAQRVDTALARLTAARVPDVRSLGHKLHVVLRAAGVAREVRAAIEADVRSLVAREGRA